MPEAGWGVARKDIRESQELKTSRALEATVRILAFFLCENGTYFNGFEQQIGILCLIILTGFF